MSVPSLPSPVPPEAAPPVPEPVVEVDLAALFRGVTDAPQLAAALNAALQLDMAEHPQHKA